MAGYLSVPMIYFGTFKISYIESISRAMSANLTIPTELFQRVNPLCNQAAKSISSASLTSSFNVPSCNCSYAFLK